MTSRNQLTRAHSLFAGSLPGTIVLIAACVLAACSDSSRLLRPDHAPPLTDILDGSHGTGGNIHFYFLQPLLTPPASFPGEFDGTLSPTVEVCQFTVTTCSGGLIADFTMTRGYGSETIRVDLQKEMYVVNWHTDRVPLDPSKTYRIRVLVREQELGYVDVVPVSSGAALRNVNTGDFVGFVDGRTVPIKFRIEKGALITPTAMGGWFAHTCGIASDGRAYCWGFDGLGELGNGSANCCAPGFRYYPDPQPVSTDVRFAAIRVGASSVCALALTGRAYCWGSNAGGAVGNPAAGLIQAEPIEVAGGHVFTQLTSGIDHFCGLGQEGIAYCWGSNTAGQLGIGELSDMAPSPSAVPGYQFISLGAGGAQTCGLTRDGEAYCWGNNYYGQVGNGFAFEAGTGQPSYGTPQRVSTSTAFTSIKINEDISCGLRASGETWCWGINAQRFLTPDFLEPIPAPVTGAPPFASITVGRIFVCGLTPSAEAYCWGDNREHEIGPGGAGSPSYPDVIPDPTLIPGFSFASINAARTYICGVLLDGTGICWGGDGQLGLANGSGGGPMPSAIAGNITWAVP